MEWDSILVLGPLLDPPRARKIKRRARALDGVRVHMFYEDMPRLLASASAIVAMAGYNTVAEILRSRVPAVLLPRCFPRKEQLIRATRLAALGLVDNLPSPSPETLRSAVERAIARKHVTAELPPMDGGDRLCSVALELLAKARMSTFEA